MWRKDIFREFGRFRASLFRRESEGSLEEIEKGGLARGSGADDENAKQRLVGTAFNEHETVTQDSLEGRWVLPSSHSAGAVDSANCAAGIAVSSTVCHALSSSVRVDIIAASSSVRWNWGDWHAASCRR